MGFFFFTCLPLVSPSKVKHLEDENKMLDTKLKILKDHEDYSGKIDGLVRQVENELEEQIENLIRDQEKLQAELLKKKEEMEDTKRKSVLLLTRFVFNRCHDFEIKCFVFLPAMKTS